MTDTTVSSRPTSSNSQIFSAILAAILASYFMTQFSLHGVDFETLGVPSEIVKSTIVGTLVGFFAKLTPANFVEVIKDIILFWVNALKTWSDAKQGKE